MCNCFKLWAKGFGEKLLIWLRSAYTNFPNADLYGKADDDVYVCPSMYDALVEKTVNQPRLGCPKRGYYFTPKFFPFFTPVFLRQFFYTNFFYTNFFYTNFLHQNFCFFTPKILFFYTKNFAFFTPNFEI